MPEIIDFKQGSRVALKLATHEKISCAVAVSRSKRLEPQLGAGVVLNNSTLRAADAMYIRKKTEGIRCLADCGINLRLTLSQGQVITKWCESNKGLLSSTTVL